MHTIDDILTLKEAADLWEINPASLRQAIHNNKFQFKQVRKSGGTWLIHKNAMINIYGEMPQTAEIYTIGYEGKNIDEFIGILQANNIHAIFDVREIPLSRKPGFSKNILEKCLFEQNIGYYNFKELGSPKELREKLYRDKDYSAFFLGYRKYLTKQPDALEILITAITQNTDKNFCLLCFEKDASTCHRSVIAQQLVLANPEISNIINL